MDSQSAGSGYRRVTASRRPYQSHRRSVTEAKLRIKHVTSTCHPRTSATPDKTASTGLLHCPRSLNDAELAGPSVVTLPHSADSLTGVIAVGRSVRSAIRLTKRASILSEMLRPIELIVITSRVQPRRSRMNPSTPANGPSTTWTASPSTQHGASSSRSSSSGSVPVASIVAMTRRTFSMSASRTTAGRAPWHTTYRTPAVARKCQRSALIVRANT